MSHDHNGRVGPPRCEECNAPLSSDEHRLDSAGAWFLCVECHLALDPLPEIHRLSRPRAGTPATSAAVSGFGPGKRMLRSNLSLTNLWR